MEDTVLLRRALKFGLKFANIPEYLLKFRIDKDFYKRRSGVKYGWNFIQTKFLVNNMLDASYYVYLLIVGNGVVKMLPSILLKYFYRFQ